MGALCCSGVSVVSKYENSRSDECETPADSTGSAAWPQCDFQSDAKVTESEMFDRLAALEGDGDGLRAPSDGEPAVEASAAAFQLRLVKARWIATFKCRSHEIDEAELEALARPCMRKIRENVENWLMEVSVSRDELAPLDAPPVVQPQHDHQLGSSFVSVNGGGPDPTVGANSTLGSSASNSSFGPTVAGGVRSPFTTVAGSISGGTIPGGSAPASCHGTLDSSQTSAAAVIPAPPAMRPSPTAAAAVRRAGSIHAARPSALFLNAA